MSAKLLDGKNLAEQVISEIKTKMATMENKPGLAAILVGDNEASKLYLKLKEKACLEAEIAFSSYLLSADVSEKKILNIIDFLNHDEQINGIIVQLPLPAQFDKNRIINTISPAKDVDGFRTKSKVTSPNILGILELLRETNTDLKGKNIVILSNSEIFCQPFKKLLTNSQVSYLDPKNSLNAITAGCKKADVLIVAIGVPYFIKPSMLKKDVILIDVGINKVAGKTVGDIDPDCDKIASWRSPVPGGVGPMTIAMLLKNLIRQIK